MCRECALYAAVLLIFLYVWGGFSCFRPNTWQGDVAFALGNVEIPQSLTLGAFVAIHNTSEWWTGSSALPGRIPFASKCVFCWHLWLVSFPGVFFTKVGCHRAPRVITVTVEQKLGWATQVDQSCFHHWENVFLWGRNKSPLWHAAFTLNTHRKKDHRFFLSLSLFCTNACNKLRQIIVASSPWLVFKRIGLHT